MYNTQFLQDLEQQQPSQQQQQQQQEDEEYKQPPSVLQYQRLLGSLPKILKHDKASAFAPGDKFLVCFFLK